MGSRLLAVIALLLALAVASPGGPAAAPLGRDLPEAQDGHLLFVENVGQWPENAAFQVWGGPAGTMWLARDAIWITVLGTGEAPPQGVAPAKMDCRNEESAQQEGLLGMPRPYSYSHGWGAHVRLTFPGANPGVRVEPFGRADTSVSYFLGNNADQWRPDVPVWTGVRYVDLYPGVDLVLGPSGSFWRWDARPGAKARPVRVRVEGVEGATVAGGAVRLGTVAGDLDLPLPVPAAGLHVEVAGVESLPVIFDLPPSAAASSPLAPAGDPTDLLYSTFLGGGSGELGLAMALDQAGSAYWTGVTWSTDFPATPGAFDLGFDGGRVDAFMAKLSPDGSELAYATYLGGSYEDEGRGIAVDAEGSAYATGFTSSGDFPTTPGAFDTTYNSGYPTYAEDAFVVKLSPAGSGLAYATFLGGAAGERGLGLVVDGAGSACVTGWTYSADFPTTPEAFDTSYNGDYPRYDAFVARLNASGSELAFGTFLGGSEFDSSLAIAKDEMGSIYVTGSTNSLDFPSTPGALQTSHRGGYNDAFVAKLSPTGEALAYSTYLGGGREDISQDIAVNGSGRVFVTGGTNSGDFPTTPGALDNSHNGDDDAFIAVLDATGSALAYATFLGGGRQDSGAAIAADGAGSAHVAGYTISHDFPTTPGAFDTRYNGDFGDAFVAKLDPAGSGLTYATFLGGRSSDQGSAIALDALGRAHVAGYSMSRDFPTTPGAMDRTLDGWGDSFVARLNPNPEMSARQVFLPTILK